MPIRVTLDKMLMARRMALSELADRTGLTPHNLDVLRSGQARALRLTTLEALCRALECQPEDLLRLDSGFDPLADDPVSSA